MISLQKTNSCLLENNTKVLGNDEVDINNQMSRKYREENIRPGFHKANFDHDNDQFESKQSDYWEG